MEEGGGGLPLVAPKVIDAQLGRVARAERSVPHGPRVPKRRLLELLEVGGFIAYEEREGIEVTYEAGKVYTTKHPRELHVVHAIAHRKTPAVFPAHGAEWAGTMLRLTAKLAPKIEGPLRRAFEREGVQTDPAAANRRARDHCRGIARNIPGALVRVVLAEPPEEVVGLVLASDANADRVRFEAGDGPVELEGSRIRYVSQPVRVAQG